MLLIIAAYKTPPNRPNPSFIIQFAVAASPIAEVCEKDRAWSKAWVDITEHKVPEIECRKFQSVYGR